ncbi:MAG: hypothetical protein HYX86_00085 [Chloroflexi bacterium]|nr:hypothetical protein [Chloroflexota bacterium]
MVRTETLPVISIILLALSAILLLLSLLFFVWVWSGMMQMGGMMGMMNMMGMMSPQMMMGMMGQYDASTMSPEMREMMNAMCESMFAT